MVCAEGHVECARLLLDAGVNINKACFFLGLETEVPRLSHLRDQDACFMGMNKITQLCRGLKISNYKGISINQISIDNGISFVGVLLNRYSSKSVGRCVIMVSHHYGLPANVDTWKWHGS